MLAFRRQSADHRISALHGMAQYHKKRKDWVALTECCKQALALFPEANQERLMAQCTHERFLLFLADAAEGQGDMGLARDYDEKAKKHWSEFHGEGKFPSFVACHRREAMELLAAGRAEEAVWTLEDAPYLYSGVLVTGNNLTNLRMLQPAVPALKVLVDALMQTGKAERISEAELIRADVEETEAILAGYWEGVLEVTRWELREQQRGGGPGAAEEAGAGEGGTEAKKKSKAAKRKEKKRRAQQQKKAARVAEVVVATAVEGVARGEVGARQEDQAQQEEEEEEEEEGHEEENSQQDVTALSAMAISGMEGQDQQEQEEEEEDECSVCLNAIESNDAANPAGPPLVCGHRYHAFCLHFWVERCTLKCIEPTCPYCRSPLQELDST